MVSWKHLQPSFMVKTCSQRCRENTGTLFASYIDDYTHPNNSLVARSRRSAQEAVVREPVLFSLGDLSVEEFRDCDTLAPSRSKKQTRTILTEQR